MESVEKGWTVRHPRLEDAREITDMIALCDVEDYGVPDITLEDLLEAWSFINYETDAWVAIASNGKIAGYAFVEKRGADRIDGCVFEHPEYADAEVGTQLLSLAEARAAHYAESNAGMRFIQQVAYANQKARRRLESGGYTFVRLYERMVADLNDLPGEVASLPAGLILRSFVPDRDERALYETYTDSFRDCWGYCPAEYDEWIRERKGERYDPALWFIVWAAEKPAAFLLGNIQEDGLFIELLGVKREWRGRGIGLALLQRAFEIGRKRGQTSVMLNVDSDSLTGANFLYAKAGMRPAFQIALYAKTLN
ncbi:GNAT family N-acetyltransferase [Paenibacillus thailandensis]|uniref:GNAT family N-acetyltransferase n=1 Tax=Paenibacillus thailandensis TaxID=393250 RepID=A0ABW5QYZ2_9BACL